MAILPLGTFLHPDKLLDAPRLDSTEEKWWVLHTRPRAEKQVASRLLNHQCDFLSPPVA